MTAVIIPYEQLSDKALTGVVEEFVTRDGTDYGMQEISLESKVSNLLNLLKNKKAVIVFDPESQTCNILPDNDPAIQSL